MDKFDTNQVKHYIQLATTRLGEALNQTRKEPISEDVSRNMKAMSEAIFLLDDALCVIEGSDS